MDPSLDSLSSSSSSFSHSEEVSDKKIAPPSSSSSILPPRILFNKYGSIQGRSELLELIKEKLEEENKLNLKDMEVMITAGGNQAFVNVALTLIDPGDTVLVLRPYYFSHVVSLQMAGANVKFVSYNEKTFLPDFTELQKAVEEEAVKMVVLTTPNNPSGVVYPENIMMDLKTICKAKGIWMVIDETYEHFVYD